MQYVRNICYSPDSNHVAFTSRQNNKTEIYVMDKPENKVQQITQTVWEKYSLVFAPDGKKIYFSQRWYDEKSPIVQIFSVNTDGTNLSQLTYTNGRMKKPFDGTKRGLQRLIDDNRETKQPFAITFDETIIFLTTNDKYQGEIWSMKSNGSDIKCRAGLEFDGIYNVHTTAVKNKILFTAWDRKADSYQLFSTDFNNDLPARQITHEQTNVGEFNISKNGEYIVILLTEDKKRGKGEIRIIHDGEHSKMIGRNY